MDKRKKILRDLLFFILFSICFGMFNPYIMSKNKPIDFENTIRQIDWYVTKENVILNENRPPDTIKSNIYRDILIFTESYLDKYFGTISYGFDKNENLRFVEFTFKSEEEYNDYMKNFIETNGKGKEEFKGYWIWEGYIGIKDTNFCSIKETFTIRKYLYTKNDE